MFFFFRLIAVAVILCHVILCYVMLYYVMICDCKLFFTGSVHKACF